jgi:hypothetical protein
VENDEIRKKPFQNIYITFIAVCIMMLMTILLIALNNHHDREGELNLRQTVDYALESVPQDTLKILYAHWPDNWWDEFAGLAEDKAITEWYSYTNIYRKARRIDESFFILSAVFPYTVNKGVDEPFKDRTQVSLCGYDANAEHGYRKILGIDNQTYPIILEYMRKKAGE